MLAAAAADMRSGFERTKLYDINGNAVGTITVHEDGGDRD
jgi:hypothetical protein